MTAIVVAPELLHLAQPLDVLGGVGGDDRLLLVLVVGDRLLGVLVHLRRVVPVVDVVLGRLRALPDARALERLRRRRGPTRRAPAG